MRISIIGSGVVGSQTGLGLKQLGHDVIFYDVIDKDLPNFTNDLKKAIKETDVSFVCVPTPSTELGIDLSYVKEAVKAVAFEINRKSSYHLVVVKSTVIPGTCENYVLPILESFSHGKFGLCMNPEFLTEINRTWCDDNNFKRDFFNEERIVIGELDKKSGEMLEAVYRQRADVRYQIFHFDLRTAEFIKYASNCCLASRISFWNEIFLICDFLGINASVVTDIVSMDPRIGKYGTVHGKAFGGKCLPKDLHALIHFLNIINFESPLLNAVERTNEEMKRQYGVRE